MIELLFSSGHRQPDLYFGPAARKPAHAEVAGSTRVQTRNTIAGRRQPEAW
jgi:hypothetical protein